MKKLNINIKKPGHSVCLGFFILLLFFYSQALAQRNGSLWTEVSESGIVAKGARYTIPQKSRTMTLNVSSMRSLLTTAPHEKSVSLRNTQAIINLPLPNGESALFRFVETPNMSPELAAKFPEIRTFTGIGVDDRSLTVAFDFTAQGFHAIVHSPENGLSFIDPFSQGDLQNYTVYAKKDYIAGSNKTFFESDVLGTNDENAKKIAALVTERRKQRMESGQTLTQRPTGDQLRTYRVAIAATGEYTAFHGGTVSAALSAINTTLNRVNFIYIREVGVRMVLVSNETNIIFTNSSTDGFSNGNSGAMLNEVQNIIDTRIGSANYDIGHVFGTNSGGVAYLGRVCQAGWKARGVTGSGSPIGDAFDVDYVAHEMGHQFGANHTFNGSTGACAGNRNANTAFEPGSGSTIMAYAGICSPQDLQPNSDAYFHVASYDEIFAYTELGSGNSCPVITNPINTAPVPTIVTTNNLTIPKQTPFTITGSATDYHNDPITYNWEEYDLGPQGSPTAPSGNAPIFRSFTATSSPSRTFPKLSNLLNNTTTIGEILPTYARTLKFNLTVRDNYPAGGGVDWAYPLNVNVSGSAGPFLVNYPNTAVSWAGNSTQTITWSVAGTNLSPINTTSVNIRLSTDGGVTFPTLLLSNTPNDGSQSISVPNITSTLARIKIEAVGNIFFDISNVNFRITATPPPSITSFLPTTGPAGVGVYIKGRNFTNVSAVRFNGVAATEYYVASSTAMYATVPSGATTGKIQVVAQGGTGISSATFTVAPIASIWVNKTGMANARAQHGAIATNNRIYSFGGVNSTGLLSSLEIYNPGTNTWGAGAPMPVATRGMSFALGSNGTIYVVSGYTGSNVTTAYRYTPSSNSWTVLASIPNATWEGAAAATSNGKVYVFGGEPVGSANSTRIYDIASNTWTAGANMPIPVMQHSAVTGNNGKIYIIGGRRTSSALPIGNVQVYDPASNTWSSGATMLIPKVQFGVAKAKNGNVYVIGGKVNYGNNASPFFHTVEIYDPVTNKWSSGPVILARDGELEAVNLNDNLYAIGGTDGTYRNYNFQLTIAPVAPTTLTASAISSTQINLKWADNALNESSYVIERATSAAGPYTVIATLTSNKTTYSNTGLSGGNTYYYRVKATNTAGSSPYSNVASAATPTAFASYRGKVDEVSLENRLGSWPNPARQSTNISFTVKEDQKVQLVIINLEGKIVEQLYQGEAQAGRRYQFTWQGASKAGGLYISRLITKDGILNDKIVILP